MFKIPSFSGADAICMQPVRLGAKIVHIPVADIVGKHPGKTLLVTAGMDGDEYAGIEAAYVLIEKYKDCNFAGRLIVVPIVNVPGFEAEQSLNPLDQKFPKYVHPGSKNGTSTERLIFWLMATYVSCADAWLDLHSGAITESIYPHVWAYETGVQSIDEKTQTFYTAVNMQTMVVQKVGRHSRAGTLAQSGCMYVVLESGDLGKRNAVDIDQHGVWTELLMHQLGMVKSAIYTESGVKKDLVIFKNIAYTLAPFNGMFSVSHTAQDIRCEDEVGTCRTYDSTKKQLLLATKTGRILWHKDTMAMRKGDILCAIAY